MTAKTFTLEITYRRGRLETRTYSNESAAREGFLTVAGNALTLDAELIGPTGRTLATYSR